jgi:hypothetical protein
MKFTMRSIAKFIDPESDRADRRPADEFAAYWWDGAGVREDAVRDVSSTGVFVRSRQRWERGDVVWLTLQRKGAVELLPERRMTMQGKAMRLEADGAGFLFVSTADAEARAWETVVERVLEMIAVHEMEGLVKAVAAIGFLCQICPTSHEIREMLSGQLSSLRVERAVEILLEARSLVGGEADAQRLRAPTGLVERILESGSNAEEDELRQSWATLLARSCTVDGLDNSMLPFVQLLGQLLGSHVRVLAHACGEAQKSTAAAGAASAAPLMCELGKIMESTGMRDLSILKSIDQLGEIGLLEKHERAGLAAPEEKLDITPTRLGLALYAHCCRHRGTAAEFYGLQTA